MTVVLADYLVLRNKAGTIDKASISVINAIAESCIAISNLVRKGALANILGSAHTTNVQNETQKRLDIIANDVLKTQLQSNANVAAIASEEEIAPIDINTNAPLLVAFDPLDGSSNIDVNISVGTIFSLLPNTPDGFLVSGRKQLVAGYCLYGPQTQLVICDGTEVSLFTLDDGIFRQTVTQLRIPADTNEYAINSANRRFWDMPIAHYINDCQQGEEGVLGKRYNTRWVASMVADVHRSLLRGGVFLYPVDMRLREKGGRIRLLYEASPMSFIVTTAGGAASTGETPLLDITPTSLHQRVSVIIGSKNEVQTINNYFAAAK